MVESMDKYLIDECSLEKVEKKTVIQYCIDNLVAVSVSRGKGNVHVSFPLFKNEMLGSRATPKPNKQRDEFLQKTLSSGYVIDNKTSVPKITFLTQEEFIAFLKKYDVVRLAKEYSKFSEVNEEAQIQSITNKDGIVLSYRANIPTEAEIVNDVFTHTEYERKGLILSDTDVVLDLGANIGAFFSSIARKVKKVIAFEPEAVNFEISTLNKEQNKFSNVELIDKAVVGNSDKTRDFYLGKVPYYYSFLVKRNRKRVVVKCVNINDVVKKYQPTKMKVDIEGSELEVLINCKDFGSVNQIIFEYNFDMNKDLKSGFQNFDSLMRHLRKHGFDVTCMERYSRSSSWAEVFCVNRVTKRK